MWYFEENHTFKICQNACMEPRFLEARSAPRVCESAACENERILVCSRNLGYKEGKQVSCNLKRTLAKSTLSTAMAPSTCSIVVLFTVLSLSFVAASRPVTVSSVVAPRSSLEVSQMIPAFYLQFSFVFPCISPHLKNTSFSDNSSVSRMQ